MRFISPKLQLIFVALIDLFCK